MIKKYDYIPILYMKHLFLFKIIIILPYKIIYEKYN